MKAPMPIEVAMSAETAMALMQQLQEYQRKFSIPVPFGKTEIAKSDDLPGD
jgi:hypothetical protein